MTGSRRQADTRPQPHQRKNDVTGGTTRYFHAGTAPRERYLGLTRKLKIKTWDAVCRHTALAAVAQLRQAAVRNHLCGDITLPPAPGASSDYGRRGDGDVSGADLGIPLGDAPVPARGGQPCPPRIAAIRLTIAETARIERLARQHAAGLITRARLAFHLRWSAWRRRHHQARARWHHYSTRLLTTAAT